jgi:hypothetical protein
MCNKNAYRLLIKRKCALFLRLSTCEMRKFSQKNLIFAKVGKDIYVTRKKRTAAPKDCRSLYHLILSCLMDIIA